MNARHSPPTPYSYFRSDRYRYEAMHSQHQRDRAIARTAAAALLACILAFNGSAEAAAALLATATLR